MFRVPSSTPPSTPDSRRQSRNGPSTTPAGPPPGRSFISSTPAGPPPTTNTLFGGSRPNFDPGRYNFNSRHSLFGSSPPKDGVLEGIGSGAIKTSASGRPGSQRGRTSSSGYQVQSSPPRAEGDLVRPQGEADDEMEDGGAEDAEGDEDEDMQQESDEEPVVSQRRPRSQDPFAHSIASRASADESISGPTIVRPGAKQQHYDLLQLAKGLAPSMERANLIEPDDVILETERSIEKLFGSVENDGPGTRAEVLDDVAHELLILWRSPTQLHDASAAGRLANASTLADLLLNIHHPNRIAPDQRSLSTSWALTRSSPESFTPIPKILLDWLNTHRSIDSELDDVFKTTNRYSGHETFWDIVHASALRGQFSKTLQLLTGASFEFAATAQEDLDADTPGYRGHHLDYAREATASAIDLLRECPGFVSDDWNIKGHDWAIFRRRVQQATNDLQEKAEGESKTRFPMSQSLHAPHFGLSQSQANFNLSMASRKAESKVPWSVYENLTKLYQILLGNEEEIIATAFDWIEATLCLTIWWDGEEEELVQGSLAVSRRSLTRSQRSRTLEVDAYCHRMAAAFAAVLDSDEDELAVKVSDRFEVGVACILDGNVEGVLHILRGSSLVIASAVAEVASVGEWFKRPEGILDQFEDSDLLELDSTEQYPSRLLKDDLLVAYAKQLTFRGQLASQNGSTLREGWELAIEVLGRLDNEDKSKERIGRILDELPLESSDRVDKITRLCHNMDLSEEALGMALKFADHLHANTHNYGDTLLYYARAHAASKVQEVLRVLVAHCLIKSVAYPPLVELDDSLRELITSPKQALTKLASTDPEAADLLSSSLSGYATIRTFYDLRDEEVLLKEGGKLAYRPMARKRTAANALIVIISSAASSIHGGLYDPEVETVVQVDVLLALLGEALVFVNQPKRTLTLRHLYELLAAVEDLSTAPSMIRAQCEEALRTTLSAAHESSPNSSFHKSTSNLTTASSQYSLIGSMDLGSVEGVSTESSTVLVKGAGINDTKRGWDWRKGAPKGTTGEDIIRLLRLGIAKELGRAFAEGEVVP